MECSGLTNLVLIVNNFNHKGFATVKLNLMRSTGKKHVRKVNQAGAANASLSSLFFCGWTSHVCCNLKLPFSWA